MAKSNDEEKNTELKQSSSRARRSTSKTDDSTERKSQTKRSTSKADDSTERKSQTKRSTSKADDSTERKSQTKRKSSAKSTGTTEGKSSAKRSTSKTTGSAKRKSSAKSTGTTRRKSSSKSTSSGSSKKQDLNQQELLFDENGNVKTDDDAAVNAATDSTEAAPETQEAENGNVNTDDDAAVNVTTESTEAAPETQEAEPETEAAESETAEEAAEAEPTSEDDVPADEPAPEPKEPAPKTAIETSEAEPASEDDVPADEPAAEPEEAASETSEETAEAEPASDDEMPAAEPAPKPEEPASETSEETAEAEPASDDEMPAAEPADEPAASLFSTANTARVFGLVFTLLLVLTFVLNIIIKDKQYSDQENRVFQQLPEFSVNNYLSGRFESQLDNYVNDQFMFRNTFIKIKSSADLTIGQLEANNVFKCQDSYLMEDITYPAKDDFDADVEALRKFKKKYSGKKMYFLLVPNAANVLKSKLPNGVVTHDQNRDIDKLFGAVEALGYKTIDVRDELKKASRSKQVYYRTDHHWTTDGAYVAYRKAAKVMKLKSNIKYKSYAVKNDFVGTLYSKSGFTNGRNDAIKIYLPNDKKALNSVIRYADTKEKTTNYYDMENLNKKDAYTVFGGTNHSLFSISTPTKRNRNLLVVKDSYANCFIPFLTQDYRSITVVDPRYYYENIATVIKANEIDEVLFLYNANTFFSDNYMRMMLTNK